MLYNSISEPNEILTIYFAYNEALLKFDELQQLESNWGKLKVFTLYSDSSSCVTHDEQEHAHLFSTKDKSEKEHMESILKYTYAFIGEIEEVDVITY